MKKIETIWHYLLVQALDEKKFRHTQQELAKNFSYSLSTVNHAVNIPSRIGALRKESKSFTLSDFDKLLYFWASMRNLEKDFIYRTYFDAPVAEIEGLALPGSVYACYSAARRLLKDAPADYAKVYFYIKTADLPQLISRFPNNQKSEANLFVLKMPSGLEKYGLVTTLPLTFVDIWNLADWYGKDFTQSLEERIHELLS